MRNSRYDSCKHLWENREALDLYLKRLKELMEQNETPRRVRMDLWTPAEKAIYDAMQEVEKAGPDVRLTDAVILLKQAMDKVGDFVDGK